MGRDLVAARQCSKAGTLGRGKIHHRCWMGLGMAALMACDLEVMELVASSLSLRSRHHRTLLVVGWSWKIHRSHRRRTPLVVGWSHLEVRSWMIHRSHHHRTLVEALAELECSVAVDSCVVLEYPREPRSHMAR